MLDPATGEPASWISRQTTWRASATVSSDVDLLKRLAEQALSDLASEFGSLGGLSLLADLTLEVHVHEGSGSEASMQTDVRNGKPHAALEILAPSRQGAQGRTVVGEPKDEIYAHKTIVHELSMLFLWQVTRMKAVGWGFFCGPEWFIDGWEEYLALTRSSTHTRTVTLPLYRERVAAKWATGRQPSIDRYIDGSIILEFMYQRLGREKLFALLQSRECTFAKALRVIFCCDETELLEEWRGWLTS